MNSGILSSIFDNMLSPNPTRRLIGISKTLVRTFAILISAYHIFTFTLGTYEVLIHNIIHLGTILAITFLTYSYSKQPSNKIPIIDIILAILSLGIMVYLFLEGFRLTALRMTFYPGSLTPLEIGMGAVLLVMVFEASRRAMGNALGLITIIFMSLALLGPYLPDIWQSKAFSLVEIIDFTVFTNTGLFGVTMSVASTYIILFLLFGALIQVSGTGDFFADLANAIAGRSRGGPGKVAVIGSALYGTISGSAAANVAVTGCVTIPLMKKCGYQPYFAAAIESTASTGGIIMPPVMGGLLFIMAELAGVNYWSLALICFIPACLYFLGIFIQVHCYAAKNNLKGIDKSIDIPSVGQTLKKGWQHIIPFVAIVYFLAIGLSPIRAALYSMPLIIIVSWFHKDTRIGIKKILDAMESAVMMMRMVTTSVGLAGIMMAAVFWTGIGSVLTTVIRSLTGDSLLPALFVTAGFCMILGLALSSIVSYLLTAILVVPSAVYLGIPPVAAHLFAVYYATMALITPPTGGVFFQAAAMADAPPMKTGWMATRLAVAGFIVPFIWIYKPALLLQGNLLEILFAVFTGIAATFVIALAVEGYWIRNMRAWERILLAISMFSFVFGPLPLIVAGFAVSATILILHWIFAKRAIKTASAMS